MSVGHSPRTAKSPLGTFAGRIDPRTWSLWSASRPFVVYVLVVDAVAIGLIAATATLVPVRSGDLIAFAVLAVASVLHLELMRGIERLRELHSVGHVYTDLKSIWTFAGLLLLPPPLLAALIVLGFVHSWLRLRRRPVVHRWTFSACNVIVASTAGGAVLAAAGAYPGLPTGAFAVAIIVGAALARWLVNRSLTSVALMLMQPGKVTWRGAYGPAGDNLIESGALGMGVLAAVVIAHAPALILILAVPVVVVHRGLLLTQFEHAAHRDTLTGLHNAGFWRELSDKTLERAKTQRATAALLLIHIDDLEILRGRHGAYVADAVLRQVAELIKRNVRPEDLPARLPGNDLALLLPGISQHYLGELVERVRAAVRQVGQSVDGGPLAVTVSIGAAFYPDNASSLDELIQAADLALIAAQTHIRDQARYSQIKPAGHSTVPPTHGRRQSEGRDVPTNGARP
jgi:diguanylate cyclase (GGDEF)-like protein